MREQGKCSRWPESLFTIARIRSAHANITFKFEGELTSVDNALSGTFSVGDKFTGTYTFDETSVDTFDKFFSESEFKDSISMMSFATKKYRASSAANGDIYHSFFDGTDYLAFIRPVSADSIDNYALDEMNMGWDIDPDQAVFGERVITNTTPLSYPFFNPDLPVWVQEPDGTYFDADGNVVYDPFTGIGINDPNLDPNQPLFFEENGSPVTFNNKNNFFLGFSDGQTIAGITGDFSSVTVVPLSAAVWLFGSGLLGIIGIAKRKQIS